MRELAKRILLGASSEDGMKEKLDTAKQALVDETDKLQKAVQDLAYRRKDPIDLIIDNIKKVNGKTLNGTGKQHR